MKKKLYVCSFFYGEKNLNSMVDYVILIIHNLIRAMTYVENFPFLGKSELEEGPSLTTITLTLWLCDE